MNMSETASSHILLQHATFHCIDARVFPLLLLVLLLISPFVNDLVDLKLSGWLVFVPVTVSQKMITVSSLGNIYKGEDAINDKNK
jgi:hypothetical protein